ncbi:MAG: DUF1549 domain-containing protein, partial [Verrucomicrobiota bacterium]
WRDWVIRAFTQNMPYDRFTTMQLAGDLYPDPTDEMQIASGFNRNSRFNEEGGADPEEWLVQYAIDRTSTLGQVWLGLTLNCAVCHSHKYDPISQKEFFQLYAFFNSLEEVGAGGRGGFHGKPVPPFIKTPRMGMDHRKQEVEERIRTLEANITSIAASLAYEEPEAETTALTEAREVIWVDDQLPGLTKAEGNGLNWVRHPEPVHSGLRSMKRVSKGNQQHFFTKTTHTVQVGEGDRLFAWIYLDPKNPPRSIMLQYNSTGAQAGWMHRAFWGENLIGYGADNTSERRSMGPLPEPGQWIRLEVDAAHIGLPPGGMIHGMAFTQFDGTAWWDTAGIVTKISQGRKDRLWIDDKDPKAAKVEGGWTWVKKDQPVFSGERSTYRTGAGLHQHYFEQHEENLTVQSGDKLFAHVYLDPLDPPKTVMLQFNADNWEHRAYWGDDTIQWGADDTDSRRRHGDLPPAGQWVRLEVDPINIGLSPGTKIHGMAFTQVDGSAWWDAAGIASWSGSDFRSLKRWEALAASDKNVPEEIRDLIAIARDRRTVEQQKQLTAYFVANVYSGAEDVFKPLRDDIAKARGELDQLAKDMPMQLVSREMKTPRDAFVLIRGDFQKKGEQVTRDVPAVFPPLPESDRRDRMALARWLTAPNHPLTARVTVNRLWAQLFGEGIVDTHGDFGTQGAFPTHPKLLDW